MRITFFKFANYFLSFVCMRRCMRLPSSLKSWPAYSSLKQKIDTFNACSPLLELMAHKSMKERHWQQISSTIQHHFDVNNEMFSLRNIMEAPLLNNKEDIEVRGDLGSLCILSKRPCSFMDERKGMW